MEQIDKDSVVELALVPHVGAPDVNSRAEMANMQRIRPRGAHTDNEGRLLRAANPSYPLQDKLWSVTIKSLTYRIQRRAPSGSQRNLQFDCGPRPRCEVRIRRSVFVRATVPI